MPSFTALPGTEECRRWPRPRCSAPYFRQLDRFPAARVDGIL